MDLVQISWLIKEVKVFWLLFANLTLHRQSIQKGQARILHLSLSLGLNLFLICLPFPLPSSSVSSPPSFSPFLLLLPSPPSGRAERKGGEEETEGSTFLEEKVGSDLFCRGFEPQFSLFLLIVMKLRSRKREKKKVEIRKEEEEVQQVEAQKEEQVQQEEEEVEKGVEVQQDVKVEKEAAIKRDEKQEQDQEKDQDGGQRQEVKADEEPSTERMERMEVELDGESESGVRLEQSLGKRRRRTSGAEREAKEEVEESWAPGYWRRVAEIKRRIMAESESWSSSDLLLTLLQLQLPLPSPPSLLPAATSSSSPPPPSSSSPPPSPPSSPNSISALAQHLDIAMRDEAWRLPRFHLAVMLWQLLLQGGKVEREMERSFATKKIRSRR